MATKVILEEQKDKALRIPSLDWLTHEKIEKHMNWLRFKKGNKITKADAAADMLKKAKIKLD